MATLKELRTNKILNNITNTPLKCIEILWDSSDPIPDLSKCINLTTFKIRHIYKFNHPLPDLSKCLKLEKFEISSDVFNHPLPDLSKCLKLKMFGISSKKFNHPLPDLNKCYLEYFRFDCINSYTLMIDFEDEEIWEYFAISRHIINNDDPFHRYNLANNIAFISRHTRELWYEFESEEEIKKNEERDEEERFNKIHQSIKEREYENKIEQLENKLEETREELGNKIEKLEQNITDLFKIIEELKHPKSFYM